MLPRSRPAGRGDSGEPGGSGLAGLDDRALVGRVADSDGAALEALYARYGRACYGLARRILADEQFAQDCVQEVFLTVWRDASRFDPTRGGFSTWLLSMTHHKAVDAVRREENLRKRRTGADGLEERQSDAPAVDDEVWSHLRRDRVREALLTLPELQREALALAYFGGYTQREIAGLTNTPLGTVKTRMLAGMRKLRGNLDGMSLAPPSEDAPAGHPGAVPAPDPTRPPTSSDPTRPPASPDPTRPPASPDPTRAANPPKPYGTSESDHPRTPPRDEL